MTIHQHVGWFKVTVYNPILMRIFKRITKLCHEWTKILPSKKLTLLLKAHGGQVLTIDILQCDKRGFVIRLYQLKNTDDIGVIQIPAFFNFPQEIIKGHRISS